MISESSTRRSHLDITLSHAPFDNANTLAEFRLTSGITAAQNSRYSEAQELLISVLVIPCKSVHEVQLRALRKLCIVQLLLDGSLHALPPIVSKTAPLMDKLWDDLLKSGKCHPTRTSTSMSPEKVFIRGPETRSVNETSDAVNLTSLLDLTELCKLVSYFRDVVTRGLHAEYMERLGANSENGPLRARGQIVGACERLLLELEPKLLLNQDWDVASLIPDSIRRSIIQAFAESYASISVDTCMLVCKVDSSAHLDAILASVAVGASIQGGFIRFSPLHATLDVAQTTERALAILSDR